MEILPGSVLQSSVHAIKLQAPQASNPKATLIFCSAINLKKSAASTFCYAVCGVLFNETYLEDSRCRINCRLCFFRRYESVTQQNLIFAQFYYCFC